MLVLWARRSTSCFLESSVSLLSSMLYHTAACPHQTLPPRHHAWPKLGSQLLAARPQVTQLSQPSVAAPVMWKAVNKSAAFIGLTRAGSVLAMSCLAGESSAASCTAEEPGVSNSRVGEQYAFGAKQPANGNEDIRSPTGLQLAAGAFVLPHPDKTQKGGEDWYFIANNSRAVGVADGVGGWAEVGVDAGAYARQLMGHAAEVADRTTAASTCSRGQQPKLSAQEILERAYALTTVRGSSTACVAVLNGDSLAVSNIGDSGLLILRGGSVAFHTPQQQHGFNFPFQIGSADSMSDHPSTAQRFEVSVQPGDLIVLGTDGLWDNCFDEEVASVLKYCCEQRMEVGKMAQVLAHYARHRASDSKFASPFAYAAFAAGYAYMGGKMDDITVVICLVQQTAKI